MLDELLQGYLAVAVAVYRFEGDFGVALPQTQALEEELELFDRYFTRLVLVNRLKLVGVEVGLGVSRFQLTLNRYGRKECDFLLRSLSFKV